MIENVVKEGNGNIYNRQGLVKLIFPLLMEQAAIAVSGVIGLAIVSDLGEIVMAAVSSVDTILTLLLYFFISVSLGGTIIVSQYMGRGETEAVKRSCVQAVWLGIILGMVIGIIFYAIAEPFVQMILNMNDAQMLMYGKEYLMGWCLSAPLLGAFHAYQGVLRGLGETVKSMKYALIANGVYIAVVAICVYGFDMRIGALTAAFFVSRLVGVLLDCGYVFNKNNPNHIGISWFKVIDPKIQKLLLYVGIPYGLEQILYYAGRMLMQRFIVNLGVDSININAICNSVINIYMIPVNAVSIGVATVVGVCIGASRIEEAKCSMKKLRTATNVSFLIVSVCTIIFLPLIIASFNPTDAVYDATVYLLTLSGLIGFLFVGAAYIYPAGMRAAGDVIYASVVSLITMWAIRILAGYIVGVSLHMGIEGIYYMMILEWVVRAILFRIRIRGTKWHSKRLT